MNILMAQHNLQDLLVRFLHSFLAYPSQILNGFFNVSFRQAFAFRKTQPIFCHEIGVDPRVYRRGNFGRAGWFDKFPHR